MINIVKFQDIVHSSKDKTITVFVYSNDVIVSSYFNIAHIEMSYINDFLLGTSTGVIVGCIYKEFIKSVDYNKSLYGSINVRMVL